MALKPRWLVAGTSGFTAETLVGVAASGCDIAGLLNLTEANRPNAPADLRSLCLEIGVPYFETEDINSPACAELIRGLACDYLLSSWPKILRRETIALFPGGVIGSHPTSLPKNRGRHPLHWAIVLGLRESHLSFFLMDEGVDSGPIVLQLPFEISDRDDIVSLNRKVGVLAREGARALGLRSREDTLIGYEQDHSVASFWRKRTPFDCLIDPRMSASSIVRLVRSFCPPYPGARLVYKDMLLTISRAECADLKTEYEFFSEPGKILEVSHQQIFLKAGDGGIRLYPTASPYDVFKIGAHVHPPARYLVEHGPKLIPFIQ